MAVIRRDIEQIPIYKPGKPIEEVRRELGVRRVIKLASNENPLGPSPKAIASLNKALSSLHRYPDGSCFYLRKRLARSLGIKDTEVLFGNGSDELIDVILKVILSDGANIVTGDLTFLEYEIIAKINRMSVKKVPLKDFRFDLPAMAAAVDSKTVAVFLANPNNPTGTYVTADDIEDFLQRIPKHILVVVDEAYREYVDVKDFPQLIASAREGRVVVLRTFSKIYGLAGLRIGYMVAHENLVKAANCVRQPFNVNSLAQAAAIAAVDDRAFVKASLILVAREKKYLYDQFFRLGIWYKQTQTNFIWIRMNTDARDVFRRLLKKGIIIRDMSQYGLNNYARVTVGTHQENQRLIAGLKNVLTR